MKPYRLEALKDQLQLLRGLIGDTIDATPDPDYREELDLNEIFQWLDDMLSLFERD